MSMRTETLLFAILFLLNIIHSGCSGGTPSQTLDGQYIPPEVPIIDSRIRSEMKFEDVHATPAIEETEISEEVPDKGTEGLEERPGVAETKVRFKEEAYKTDKEYLAIKRHERLFLRTDGENGKGLKMHLGPEPRDTVRIVDKPLVLAGKGFNIESFRTRGDERLHFDFNRFLKKPYPLKPERKAVGKLELDIEHTKSIKKLIFHPLSHALSKNPGIETEKPETVTEEEKAVYVRRIPETKLLLERDRKTQIFLERGERSIDILAGNETINKEIYKNW